MDPGAAVVRRRSGAPAGRRRGPSKGDRREQAIVEVAAQLLQSRPVEDLTVDDLAAGAGISRSTFYFYFDSIDAVVRALAVLVGDELGQLLGAPHPEVPPRDTIRSNVEAYLRRWRRHGHILRAMQSRYELDPWLRSYWDGVSAAARNRLAQFIDQERRRGRATGAVPAEDLAAVLGAMAWRCGYEVSLRSTDTDDRTAEAMTEVWARTVYGTADPAP